MKKFTTENIKRSKYKKTLKTRFLFKKIIKNVQNVFLHLGLFVCMHDASLNGYFKSL